MSRAFNFDLYRLNIVDIQDLFLGSDASRIRTDEDILTVLDAACSSDFDLEQETRSARYKWSVRNLYEYEFDEYGRRFVSIVLARSVLEKEGLIVTDYGINAGASSANPPLASAIILFFDMNRHLVAVEHSGELAQTAWHEFLSEIINNAAISIEKSSSIELGAVPEDNEILSLFKSFDKVTRIKATINIPNPELTRYTKLLYDDLVKSGVREYTQDMKNPNGLSKEEDARPFATAALVQQGYKSGEVQIEGLRGESYDKVSSGSVAARGSISTLKDFVRGLHANAKAKETKNVLSEIAKEIDRIHPIEANNES